MSSNKPMGLSARLNRSKAMPGPPGSGGPEEIAAAVAYLDSITDEDIRKEMTEVWDYLEKQKKQEAEVPVPPRTYGAWTNGISTIRNAALLPDPVTKRDKRGTTQPVNKMTTTPVYTKDPLGYITDEDENQDE